MHKIMMSQNKSNCLHANYSWIIKSSGHYTKCMVTWGQIQTGRESTVFLCSSRQIISRWHSVITEKTKPRKCDEKGSNQTLPMSKVDRTKRRISFELRIFTENDYRETLEPSSLKDSKSTEIRLRWPKCSHE